jgi:hypothetical protein
VSWFRSDFCLLSTGFLQAHAGVSLTSPDPNVANNGGAARTWVNP